VIAAADVSFCIAPGECVALVGPSGSGKSTIARCVVGLHPPTRGVMRLDGRPLAARARRRSADQQRRAQLVAQDAAGALNPGESVEAALTRPLCRRGVPAPDMKSMVQRLLTQVHLPLGFTTRRPHQLSGGERQRVNLARALAADPSLLVCDEVTSALDATTQQATLNLLAELRSVLGLSMLFITHDLACVARLADRVLVLDVGQVVESATTRTLLAQPQHRLTQNLLEAASMSPNGHPPCLGQGTPPPRGGRLPCIRSGCPLVS